MVIGWLHDDIGIIGGAELSCTTLKSEKPSWVETIVDCRPHIRPPEEVDVFIVQNCITYGREWIEVLEQRPVIKQMRDMWTLGDPLLRRWLLENSRLRLFSSPFHRERFPFTLPPGVRNRIVPPPVPIDKFRAAAKGRIERSGALFVGRVDNSKGFHVAVDWAIQTGKDLDVYGTTKYSYRGLPDWIHFHGPQPYEKMPEIFGSHLEFVFFPRFPESFGRTVVEAWAAGCRLITNSDIGALWWINYCPDQLERGVELFWKEVREAL